MAKNKTESLPSFDSLNELVEFFDTRDRGDYWKEMAEAHFDLNIKRKNI